MPWHDGTPPKTPVGGLAYMHYLQYMADLAVTLIQSVYMDLMLAPYKEEGAC